MEKRQHKEHIPLEGDPVVAVPVSLERHGRCRVGQRSTRRRGGGRRRSKRPAKESADGMEVCDALERRGARRRAAAESMTSGGEIRRGFGLPRPPHRRLGERGGAPKEWRAARSAATCSICEEMTG
jgi:hypothetical protein